MKYCTIGENCFTTCLNGGGACNIEVFYGLLSHYFSFRLNCNKNSTKNKVSHHRINYAKRHSADARFPTKKCALNTFSTSSNGHSYNFNFSALSKYVLWNLFALGF
jgi:hypothetical protein